MRYALIPALSAFAVSAALAAPASAQTLNVVTAGDQNMVDYVNNYLGPKFEKMNPGVKVRAVGTGPGDGGSQKIYEKLSAQQKPARRPGTSTSPSCTSAAGDDGQGEAADAVPQRHRRRQARVPRHGQERARRERRRLRAADVPQPDRVRVQPRPVKDPPKSYAELAEWVKKNPKQFGYNGVKGGMSGVGFVMGWVDAYGGIGDKLEKGPYDAGDKADLDKSLADLKDFNKNVVMTPGNAGTLDMLNRGEIAMGPVWVDMFYTWQADGKLTPNISWSCRRRACRASRCTTSCRPRRRSASSRRNSSSSRQPRSAGRRHRQEVQLVSRHRPAVRAGEARQADWTSSSPTSRRPTSPKNGRPFPLAPYFTDILEGYERKVAN